ncbi:TPA: heparinase II/III family protein [Klebsiella aerogenes]
MKQFSFDDIRRLQQAFRENPQILEQIRKDNKVVLSHPVLVQEYSRASWELFYYCPTHAVPLIWDRESPDHYRCPVDGEILTGEPYRGAWWRKMNDLNARACYQLGVAWMLTGDNTYFTLVREILMEYARHYPHYVEHGGIPYNGPGKMNAQTLCDAMCLSEFVKGYDLIHDGLTPNERQIIEKNLLRAAADFIISQRWEQLHNHEVRINSALAMVGAVLDDPLYLEIGVNALCGLRYQLRHGVLKGGLWFEGSLHYHHFALQGFFEFERMVRYQHHEYSLTDLPYYKKMLDLPVRLLMPDDTEPTFNDCIPIKDNVTYPDLYEFAYATYGDETYARMLSIIYDREPRTSLAAFLYGDPRLRLTEPVRETANYHDPDNGITIIRNARYGRAVVVKHTPFGGEHDHYDKPGLIIYDENVPLLPDMGTTGYGAPMHYSYYKNTLTHNVLCAEGFNQPPVNPKTISFTETDDYTEVTVEVDWRIPPAEVQSLTRVEWNAVAYRDIVYRRKVIVYEHMVIDISRIINPHRRSLDNTLLIDGTRLMTTGNYTVLPEVDERDPRYYFSEYFVSKMGRTFTVPFRTLMGKKIHIHCACSDPEAELHQLTGPANPPIKSLSYLKTRSRAAEFLSVNVIDLHPKGEQMQNVFITLHPDSVNIASDLQRGIITHHI